MTKASYRKPRKNKAVSEGSKIFSESIQNKDYETASRIAYLTTHKVGGTEGFMGAMEDANNFLKRKRLRKGL